VDAHGVTLVPVSTTQMGLPTCYRHPDRETGLSCSECGRPICTECMTVAPVGLRCPDHAGARASTTGRKLGSRGGIVARAPHMPLGRTEALVTKALIAVNVAIYLIGAVQGAGINSPGGQLYAKLWLFGPEVAHGDWWRLVTTMFLHANLLHIGFNMLALWWFGAPVEQYLGRARFLGLYFVAGLAGSAGALVQTPGVTVGASGAIFGILGAMLILEWQATGRLGGNAMTLIVINLALSFAIANISIGGHIGGLIGGILATLAFARWGRGHAAYGRIGLGGALGLVLIAGASIAIAYWQVRGLA
jgi:membrane associated rhomboid family serine protease